MLVKSEVSKQVARESKKVVSQAANAAKTYFARFAGGLKFEWQADELDDPLDAQMEMNNDSLINKILYYLSKLPIQYSF